MERTETMKKAEMKKRALKNLDMYINGLKNAQEEFQFTSNYFGAYAVLFVIYYSLEIISENEFNELDKEIKEARKRAREEV